MSNFNKQPTIGTTAGTVAAGDDIRLSAKATADIILAVTTSGNDNNAARPSFITGGDYSAQPFLTFQAALDSCAKLLGAYTLTIEAGAGNFAGFSVKSFLGQSTGVVIRGTFSLATLTSGPNSFTANTGTTSTSLKRNGGVAWTVNNLRGKIVHVVSGGGFNGSIINESIGVITGNDADTAFIQGQGIFGLDNTSVVQIVNPATVVTTGSYDAAAYGDAGIVVIGNTADVVLSRLGIDFSDATFIGYLTGSNSGSVIIQGNSIGAAYHSLNNDTYHYLNNNILQDNASLVYNNVRSIASYGMIIENATVDISVFQSATLDYTSAKSVTIGNAVKVYKGNYALIGLDANGCTASPLILQNISNMGVGAAGLTGTNAGTTRAIEISNGGYYSLNGATIAGSSTDTVLLENKAISYANLGAQGTTRRFTTSIQWGSGRERMLQKIYVPSDPTDTGDEIATDGDNVVGGRIKHYGQFTLLNPAQTEVDGAGATQGTATNCALHVTVCKGGAIDTGLILIATGIGIGDGGVPTRVYNISGSNKKLYPPTGGIINTSITNASIDIPDNGVAFVESRGSINFLVKVL